MPMLEKQNRDALKVQYFAGVHDVTDVRDGDRRFCYVSGHNAHTRSGWRRLEHLQYEEKEHTKSVVEI